MANLTLAIDDAVLKEARKYAIDHNTSVNQLVRDYLANLSGQEEARKRANARLKELINRGICSGEEITWTRDELYER